MVVADKFADSFNRIKRDTLLYARVAMLFKPRCKT
jgi:hypothetical protein